MRLQSVLCGKYMRVFSNLFEYMCENGTFSESEARPLFHTLVETCVECADRGVFHRDIKSENIIISNKQGWEYFIIVSTLVPYFKKL